MTAATGETNRTSCPHPRLTIEIDNTEFHEGSLCFAKRRELKSIQKELGYVPSNLVRVAVTFSSKEKENGIMNQPIVLLLYPLKKMVQAHKKRRRAKMEPFPTIYWLASSELKAKISILEDHGHLLALQERLDASPKAQQKMIQSHMNYARERWNLLTQRDQELVMERKGWKNALHENVGIAGIRNFGRVKCLHTHYAHYLATKDNIIGQWVQELLDQQVS